MLTESQIEAIEAYAQKELLQEEFNRRVKERVEQLRKQKNLPWYKKLFPFKITIERII